MSDFFTSDTHFFHANIIKYAHRPFKDEYEMNAAMVKNWNSVVQPNDRVFHLGDFSVGLAHREKELRELAYSLNGQIFLIRGNHERAAEEYAPQRFAWIRDYYEYRQGKTKIVCFHYAQRVWNASHHGVWHLYGHSHGDLPENESLSFDIGVDSWNYTPASLDQIAAKMAAKKKALEASGKTGDWSHHGRTDDVPMVGRK